MAGSLGDPWDGQLSPGLSPVPHTFSWRTCAWVVFLSLCVASLWLLRDGLLAAGGGEQQGRGGVQGTLPGWECGPVSGGKGRVAER